MTETKRTAAQIRTYMAQDMKLHEFSELVGEDMPRLLDAAVGLREMLDDVMCYAIDAGRRSDYERARKLWLNTGWLADSPNGESMEESDD